MTHAHVKHGTSMFLHAIYAIVYVLTLFAFEQHRTEDCDGDAWKGATFERAWFVNGVADHL